MSKISIIEGKTIYYLAPDYDIPSWGNAILYAHVKLLNKNGINAKILHHQSPFRYSWFQSDVPILYLNDPELKISKEDYLVVPEVNILDNEPQKIKCNKIVFIQGGFLILLKMQKAQDFSALGYNHVIVTMPNIKKIVDTHFGAKAYIIPAYIAPYFFINNEDLKKERSKTVLLFPKDVYRQLGQLDYDILKKMLDRRFANNAKKLLGLITRQDKSKWHMVELRGKTHLEVASIMKESSFFVCVNTVEGFNVAVPEAMAAGCIPICYDAYGGDDYLEDNVNAFVFKNNYIYPLLEKLFYLMDNYDNIQDELSQIRKNGYNTALRYTEKQMEESLLEFYTGIIN
ncbi:MAG: hypothetical protein DHS20C13_06470 [Thermodesulfobacteriota bacterium]|nr:MAG: hypothetical protein DHS20C13_06470 [Thermodesulfobacteriota bacterium]